MNVTVFDFAFGRLPSGVCVTQSHLFTVPVSPIHIVFELSLGGSGVPWGGVP